tara:strand:+ start:50 stop:238 length:189 start_codon:yes stop_codon:yes gene_type:complete
MKEKNKKNILSRMTSWLCEFVDEKLPAFFSRLFWVMGHLFSALLIMILIFLFCFRAIDYILG